MRGVSHPAIILRGPTRYEQNKKGPFLSAPLTITFLATDADLGKNASEKLASSMTLSLPVQFRRVQKARKRVASGCPR